MASHQQGELVNDMANVECYEGVYYHYACVLMSVFAPELITLLDRLPLAQSYHPPKLITRLYSVAILTFMT